MSCYKAMVAINSLGSQLFNLDNETQVLGTGLVPHVAKLLLKRDHPFLQHKALDLLINIAKKVSRNQFHAFCNQTTIPFVYLLECLNSPQDAIVEGSIELLTKLGKKRYRISTDDSNL